MIAVKILSTFLILGTEMNAGSSGMGAGDAGRCPKIVERASMEELYQLTAKRPGVVIKPLLTHHENIHVVLYILEAGKSVLLEDMVDDLVDRGYWATVPKLRDFFQKAVRAEVPKEVGSKKKVSALRFFSMGSLGELIDIFEADEVLREDRVALESLHRAWRRAP